MDPLQSLTAAISMPADSQEQVSSLLQLREQLEQQAGSIPVLCTTLLPTVVNSKDSAFKRWVLELLHFGLSKSSLPLEGKAQLASQSLDSLNVLLNETSVAPVKLAIHCMCSVYPLLFRFLCGQRHLRGMWDGLTQAKRRILAMVDSPRLSTGVKLSALKFMQRVILVQSRNVSDPRLQNRSDANLSQCPPDHPFMNPSGLESEGVNLLQELLTILYSAQDPEVLTAICNTFVALVKLRPGTVQLIVSALAAWTPVRLAGELASSVKSVEKAVRIVLVHISRHGFGTQYQKEINEALTNQQARMEVAAREEHARRLAAADGTKKRSVPLPAPDDLQGKRMKVEGTAAPMQANPEELLSYFAGLPINLITDLVIANLQAIPQARLNAAVEAYRQQHPPPSASMAPGPSEPVVKEEVDNPLNLELDEDEIEFEPDKLNLNLQVEGDNDVAEEDAEDFSIAPLRLVEFELPPPRKLTPDERAAMIKDTLLRIRESGEEMSSSTVPSIEMGDGHPEPAEVGPLKRVTGLPPTEAWIVLLVRMASRGPAQIPEGADEDTEMADGDDEKSPSVLVDRKGKGKAAELGDIVPNGLGLERTREMLCDYIMHDFPSRVRLANVWLNEEWYNDTMQSEQNPAWQLQYDIWLQRIISLRMDSLDPRDKTFPQFLIDLPSVPSNVFYLLRELCCDAEKMPVGFTTLRELVSLRPPLRHTAMNILLELTTHPDKVTRGASIITVRRWLPDQKPMVDIICEYALRLLQRLETLPRPEPPPANTDTNMEGTEAEDEPSPRPRSKLEGEPVKSIYLPDALQPPVDKAVVLQHVELILALSVKLPDFLDEIFVSYGQMDESVQNAIKEHIVQLIKTLGPNNGKLLTVMRTFPPAAESLALRALMILTEHQRPTGPLVALVKSLIAEHELDARFIIPIIGELEKTEIIKHLPRIVSMLNGKPEEREIVRKVFANVITTESPTGGASSNMPRVKQDHRLAPADLMVLLHEREKEIGLKSAIEAISICFSMTDVFRWEVLAIVMQQIVDEPTLPVLFMRTVIQAVTTYKNLVSFVTTTLFTRLIVKKIWSIPPLWEGFIRCAKVTAPASFGALLSLHKDQLREVVDKQPGLKSGLRDHLIKKAGSKAKASAAWDVLGDEDTVPSVPTPSASGV